MSRHQVDGSITLGIDMDYLARRVADLVVADLADRIAVRLPAGQPSDDYHRDDQPAPLPDPDQVGGWPVSGRERLPEQPPPAELS